MRGWRLGGVLRGVVLTGVALWGCDAPAPTVSPAEPPEAPVPPAEPEEEPYPVVSRCESGTIRVSAPRRVDERYRSRCSEAYEVDFVVEGAPGDTMLLDMFQTHTLRRWRVEADGEGVRHAFTLRMQPFWAGIVYGPEPAGIRGHEPIVVQRCPEGEGEGSVLACTTVGCGIYDDVSEVPPLMPSDLELAITLPPAFLYDTVVRAGDTVEIPLTFRIFRPLERATGVVLELEGFYPGEPKQADIEISPAEIVLPAGSWRTQTRIARLTVKRYDYPEIGSPDSAFYVLLKPWGPADYQEWEFPRCVNPPDNRIVFVLVPEDW